MWYRLECDVGDDELWEELGSRLGVPGPHAFGHYGWFTGRYGERWIRGKIKGRLDSLQDATIEKWARWAGTPGAFAAALRELCTDTDSGELKGFRRRNAKILLKQLRDARKKKGESADSAPPLREPALDPAREPRENPHAYDDNDGNGYEKNSSTTTAREVESVLYAQRCTVAGNRGLRDNPKVNGFRELVTSNQVEVTDEWRAKGIPCEFAEQVVYQRAEAYQPRGSNRQPVGLNYFTKAILTEWEVEQGRGLERDFQPKPTVVKADSSDDEFVIAGRQLDKEREGSHGEGH
jgi:hypothetical protein